MPKNTVHEGASVYDAAGDNFAAAIGDAARANGLTEESPGVYRGPEGKRYTLTLTESTDEPGRAGSDRYSGPDATPYGDPDEPLTGRQASDSDVHQNKADKSSKSDKSKG